MVIAFRRSSQSQVDSWLGPAGRTFGPDTGVKIYEIPMIGTRYGRLMAGRIDTGMRSGISPEKHPFVITCYGDLAPYKKALEMPDPSLVYVFLLDREGRIRWRNSGRATKNDLQDLIETASRILGEA
jgi:hypothetical protein